MILESTINILISVLTVVTKKHNKTMKYTPENFTLFSRTSTHSAVILGKRLTLTVHCFDRSTLRNRLQIYCVQQML